MLEFIVLGEIPGTHIIITFQWAILLAAAVLGVALLRAISRREHRSSDGPQFIEEITL